MARSINLLPTEFTPSIRLVRIGNAVRMLAVIGFSVFVLAVAGMISLFLFDSFSMTSSQARQEAAKVKIKSLESVEQKFVLVSDRLEKAKAVLAEKSAVDALAKLSGVLSSLSGGAFLTEAELNSEKTKFSVIASNSSDMARFLAVLTSGGLYKKIDLSAFGFTPQAGYLLSLEAYVDTR